MFQASRSENRSLPTDHPPPLPSICPGASSQSQGEPHPPNELRPPLSFGLPGRKLVEATAQREVRREPQRRWLGHVVWHRQPECSHARALAGVEVVAGQNRPAPHSTYLIHDSIVVPVTRLRPAAARLKLPARQPLRQYRLAPRSTDAICDSTVVPVTLCRGSVCTITWLYGLYNC